MFLFKHFSSFCLMQNGVLQKKLLTLNISLSISKDPGPSMSNEDSGPTISFEDSGSLVQSQSQSILVSQRSNNKTVVEQTEDDSSDDQDERGADCVHESPMPNSSTHPKINPIPTLATNIPDEQHSAAVIAHSAGNDAQDEEEEEEEEERLGRVPQDQANAISTSFVTDEIKNCQHQINVASIALEQLRKVKPFFLRTFFFLQAH